MKCPACDATARDGAAFCPDCGASLSGPAGCAACGEALTPGASFCRECGASVSAGTGDPATPLAERLGSRGMLAAIAASLLLVALAIGAVFFFILAGDDDDGGMDILPLEIAEVELSEAVRSELQAAVEEFPQLAGETEAEQLQAFLGPPDLFELSFQDGDDGVDRLETWTYYDMGIAFELLNSDVLVTYPIDEPEGLFLIPLRYDPLAFQPDTTVDEVRAMLDDPDSLASEPAPEGYGLEFTVWAGEQLAVIVDAGDALVLVETFALRLDEAVAE